ncbi:Ser/Thr protein phosphatase family protein [Paecilomyces variotii No. 5]|uniref:Ser/Thr protein phosphatase family protein n=1 Tax=Byssochlamys spectabilis (strain No. 5 / NBRC 109023) TaxID=1356009 RepID=V5FZ35_BYSSN|nr:Ser/Thr protein phosphatase family protein [Paecilomyces variotii No. 5]
MDHPTKRLYRKTRIVCVSDTHGYTPSEAGFRLPKGDILIHAGDLTNHGSMAELQKTIDWISNADYEVRIIVAGNHDITLDPEFYAQHGPKFHKQNLQDPQKCLELITASSSIVFLNHTSTTIRLTKSEGPRTIFTVFGSPYSRFKGDWAFGYEPEGAYELWQQIPMGTDILVTHVPPKLPDSHHGDRVAFGCEELYERLKSVRPMLAVSGHVHESRGYHRVRWESSSSDNGFGEEEIMTGNPPPIGSKKQSLIDLTGKKQKRLDNFSLTGHEDQNLKQTSISRPEYNCFKADDSTSTVQGRQSDRGSIPLVESNDGPKRRETCVVNAAIVATSWPHKEGKKFHAPIVVDLDLPVWDCHAGTEDNTATTAGR